MRISTEAVETGCRVYRSPRDRVRGRLRMPVRKIPKNYESVTGLLAADGRSNQVTAYESSLERDCTKHPIINPFEEMEEL